ncbi:GNAT family N-acetyltransferase [Polaromonas sp.]|uniref:GNAT family N-acetyltransferase n=1 Tax=Polaromonas sp. TaxID=1869339 RepID=UPI00356B2354
MRELGSFPPLSTQRLVLREILPHDAEDIFGIFSDAEVMTYYDSQPMTSLQEAKAMIDRFAALRQNDSGCRWGLTLKGSDKIVGTCGIFGRNKAFFSAASGYELSPPCWGSGLMAEALAAVLAYAFDHLGLNRIQATTNLDNHRSIRSLVKLGFKEEGILRQWGFWKDQFHDVRCFSLLKCDHNHQLSTGESYERHS